MAKLTEEGALGPLGVTVRLRATLPDKGLAVGLWAGPSFTRTRPLCRPPGRAL